VPTVVAVSNPIVVAPPPDEAGVESNQRLTAALGALLLVLLAVEGVTVLSVTSLLRWHVAIGMLVAPPVMLKTGTTAWRIARYYLGAPPYVRRGPPHPVLRVLGPLVIVLSWAVLLTGMIALWKDGGDGSTMLKLHKASFIAWFAVMTLHVLGHVLETIRVAPLDWGRGPTVPGVGMRRGALVASLVAGAGLALLGLAQVSTYLAAQEVTAARGRRGRRGRRRRARRPGA